jgi:hypothetical protein
MRRTERNRAMGASTRRLAAAALGSSLLLLVFAASASASLTLNDGAITISAVDQTATEIDVPFDFAWGTDGHADYSGAVGSRTYTWLQGGDGIPDQVPWDSTFLDTDLNCIPEEPYPHRTMDPQSYCWSYGVNENVPGAFGPVMPLTATSGVGAPLVFDDWNVTNAPPMLPIFEHQTAPIPGYCRTGDRGFVGGGVAYQGYVPVSGDVGYQAAYAPATPDTSPPVIAMDTLLDCATFERNATESAVGRPATFDFACADPGHGTLTGPTGVASCSGSVNGSPVADGDSIDTSTPGLYTLTVTAQDVAGNVRTATATYHVVRRAVSSVTAPQNLKGGAFELAFSRPVHGLDSSDFLVRKSAGGNALAGSIVCLDGSRAAVNCISGQVRYGQFWPRGALVAGKRYHVVLTGAKTSAIADQNGLPVPDMNRAVRAQTVFASTDPSLSYGWGHIDVSNPEDLSRTLYQDKWQGASETFSFTGTSLDIPFWADQDRGKARVRITTPGAPAIVQTVDTYAASPGRKTVSRSGLSPGKHTVTITVLGTKRAASSDTWVGVEDDWVTPIGHSALTHTWSPILGYAFTTQNGASLTLSFQGSGITWNAFVGPNDGQAEVAIDGTTVTQDLYAPDFGFQDFTYDGLGPGTHTLEITVAGAKQAASSDVVVTVNSITVL